METTFEKVCLWIITVGLLGIMVLVITWVVMVACEAFRAGNYRASLAIVASFAFVYMWFSPRGSRA